MSGAALKEEIVKKLSLPNANGKTLNGALIKALAGYLVDNVQVQVVDEVIIADLPDIAEEAWQNHLSACMHCEVLALTCVASRGGRGVLIPAEAHNSTLLVSRVSAGEFEHLASLVRKVRPDVKVSAAGGPLLKKWRKRCIFQWSFGLIGA